ncbi:HAD family hydrolase [Zhihengliuella flava]|uniref:Cof subfamily protein (Haloacid dehalogenase superfamily) n=1 Tax=Zhihengliuella flava TaxID=1285193 RepID=A0A931DC71_9MICC|nr:Cof subfamily protein (haloacid dehalogenase superfamily) [Zhihengliuella flava]
MAARGAAATPPEQIRLIASDIDGTILHPDNSISARTVAAFHAARAAGIEIVFVTGRPFRWLTPVQQAFGHLGTVICSNGALVYDLEAERILESRTLDAATVEEVRARVLAVEPETRFAAETAGGLYLEPGFVDPAETALLDGVVPAELPLDRLESEGTVKLLAKLNTTTSDAFRAAVYPRVQELVSVTHSAPGVALLEMSRRDVNKAVALERYAAGLGVGRREVVAFGDMPNDLEMLSWAGWGCAMGSGHRLAKEAAAAVTGTLEDDGVAEMIEHLLAATAGERTVREARTP